MRSLIALTALLFILKVAGVLDWSWVWVFAPLWIPASAAAAFMALLIALLVVSDR